MKHKSIFLEGLWKLFLILFPCLVFSAFLGWNIPLLLKKLSLNFSNYELFKKELMILSGIFILTFFNRVIYQLTINKFVKDLVQKMRVQCFKKWVHTYEVQGDQRSEKKEQTQYSQGEVITRILNDTESVRELITSGTFGILIDSFFVISCLISFINLNSTLGGFLTIIEVIAVILLIKGSKIMRKVFLEVGHSRGRVSRTMANLIGGIRESYYTPHYNYASSKGGKAFDDFLSIQLKSNMWDATYYSIAESLYPILLALMVLIFPYTHITEGAIVFVIIDLIQRSIAPIKDIAGKISNVQRAMAGVIRINEFIGDLNHYPSSEGLKNIKGDEKYDIKEFKSIEVKIESFSYPNRGDSAKFSLTEIDFTAKADEFYGIVGTSGCGKSTLFNIMAAKIYPGQGTIKINFKNGKCVCFPSSNPLEWRYYRQMIGLVGQDSHIFSESLRFNITMGRDSEVEDNTQDISNFFGQLIEEIPYFKSWGIDLASKINPAELSVGQKQLLAAVRALYWKRPIILFDEIASALDSRLELALRRVIKIIQKNSLVFIIAHRVETVLDADRIIAMDQGRINGIGNHQELLEKSIYYKNFIDELMQTPKS